MEYDAEMYELENIFPVFSVWKIQVFFLYWKWKLKASLCVSYRMRRPKRSHSFIHTVSLEFRYICICVIFTWSIVLLDHPNVISMIEGLEKIWWDLIIDLKIKIIRRTETLSIQCLCCVHNFQIFIFWLDFPVKIY